MLEKIKECTTESSSVNHSFQAKSQVRSLNRSALAKLTFLLIIGSAQACDPGYYSTWSRCEVCSAGKYISTQTVSANLTILL